MHRIALRSVALMLTALGGILFGQGVTGTIAGTITDSSGGRLAQAQVRVINEQTGDQRKDVTNDAGDYLFPNLPIGRYRVEAELSGFRKFIQQGIQLNVN